MNGKGTTIKRVFKTPRPTIAVTTPKQRASAGDTSTPVDQSGADTHPPIVRRGTPTKNSRSAMQHATPIKPPPIGSKTPPQAIGQTTPISSPSTGGKSSTYKRSRPTKEYPTPIPESSVGDQISSQTISASTSIPAPSVRKARKRAAPATKTESAPNGSASLESSSSPVIKGATPTTPTPVKKKVRPRDPAIADAVPIAVSLDLADDVLKFLARANDVLEATREQFDAWVGQMTRVGPDKDGKHRGLGLDESDPLVCLFRGLAELAKHQEVEVVKLLEKRMKAHPLGSWAAAQKGVGAKQFARLFAAIGDPYMLLHIKHEDGSVEVRHRRVSDLWAYCGLYPVDGVAVHRKKGQKANWSTDAKTRAYLIAEKCKVVGLSATCKQADGPPVHVEGCACSPYRLVHDERKAVTVGRVHTKPCVRCGPQGHPAAAGTPWSDAHRQADALHIASKELLRDLWYEGRRLHEEAA